MPTAVTNAASYQFDPSALLSLFTIDSRYVAAQGQILYFHAGVNGLYEPVIFNGIEYTPFPIEMTEYSVNGQGELSRPKIRASNINGFLSQYLRVQGDMVGARFTRTRVFARFIDAANFVDNVNPFGTPNTSAAYEPEIFYINRKVSENPEYVEFELASPLEIENVQLPRRVLTATVCTAQPYRDPETCGYGGPPLMDRFGITFAGGYNLPTLTDRGAYAPGTTYAAGDYVTINSQSDFSYGDPFVYVCKVDNTVGAANNPQFNSTNWVADACPHNLSGCLAHFPPPAALPFLGFPGISRSSYVD